MCSSGVLFLLIYTIRVLNLPDKWSNYPICESDPVCLCFLCFNNTHLFHIHLYQTPTHNPLEMLLHFKNNTVLVTFFPLHSHTSGPILLQILRCHAGIFLCWSRSQRYSIYKWFHITCGWYMVGRLSVKCVEWLL